MEGDPQDYDADIYDVVVIGAGSTGENVAARSVKGGRYVVVVGAELVGWVRSSGLHAIGDLPSVCSRATNAVVMTGSDEVRTRPEAGPEEVERAARALFQTLLKASELPPALVSGAGLAALRAIESRAGLSVAELARDLGTIPSWSSRLCDRLETDGYIERRRSEPGRRQVAITLTASGERLLNQIELRRRQALVGVLERMTAPERAALLAGLAAFTRARDDAGDGGERTAGRTAG